MSTLNRLWRHLWAGEREARRAFPPAALKSVADAVAASERLHRGELRVVIQGGLGWAALRGVPDSRALALAQFAHQGVWDTAENSGVLIYVLMAEHKLEILADRGIHARVPQVQWDLIAQLATQSFAQNLHLAGLSAAVEAISALLAQHFPAVEGDHNELPDAPLRF
jgi:TPM domain